LGKSALAELETETAIAACCLAAPRTRTAQLPTSNFQLPAVSSQQAAAAALPALRASRLLRLLLAARCRCSRCWALDNDQHIISLGGSIGSGKTTTLKVLVIVAEAVGLSVLVVSTHKHLLEEFASAKRKLLTRQDTQLASGASLLLLPHFIGPEDTTPEAVAIALGPFADAHMIIADGGDMLPAPVNQFFEGIEGVFIFSATDETSVSDQPIIYSTAPQFGASLLRGPSVVGFPSNVAAANWIAENPTRHFETCVSSGVAGKLSADITNDVEEGWKMMAKNIYGWMPYNASFGFLDIAGAALGVFASLDRF
jgi:hypothetical protein